MVEANNCDDLKGNSDPKVKSLAGERGQCPGTASPTTLSTNKRQWRINPHSPTQGTKIKRTGCDLKSNSF